MAKVLLAEDSATQVVLLKSLLEDDLHRVTVASNGLVALDMISQHLPDVVITDMQMPEMNGLELVKHLRSHYPQVPVILITAQDSDDLSVSALKEGAAAYLPKSRVDEELLDLIEHVLKLLETNVSYRNLIDCLDYYEFQFSLTNDPSLIAPLVNFMQQMAAGMQYCDDVVRARIGMAIEQALLNALYHGNLNIGHDEQIADEELQVDDEPSLVEQRRNDPLYADRKIQFKASLGQKRLCFTIADQGDGFDHLTLCPVDSEAQLSTDRRGLVLIRSFMDEVRFNEKGNEITLVHYASHDPA